MSRRAKKITPRLIARSRTIYGLNQGEVVLNGTDWRKLRRIVRAAKAVNTMPMNGRGYLTVNMIDALYELELALRAAGEIK